MERFLRLFAAINLAKNRHGVAQHFVGFILLKIWLGSLLVIVITFTYPIGQMVDGVTYNKKEYCKVQKLNLFLIHCDIFRLKAKR